MKKLFLFMTLVASPAGAEPMHFEQIRSGGNCADCAYTQATGEVAPETSQLFDAYARSREFGPGRVRLNSPGGSLIGGILLGELFRANGISTEVGSSAPIVGATEPGLAGRTPGVCASACAYAFLGGVERSLDDDAKLGFHRFYQQKALAGVAAKIFTGKDLDNTQRVTAALVLYTIKMGVDPRLVALASEASPDEVWWVPRAEARELRVIYEPSAYKPWHLEPYHGGAIATTESNDGLKSIVVSCSPRLGPTVAVINAKPNWDVASWFEQCRTLDLPGGHPVFGARVNPSQIQVIRQKDGGVVMRFQLPTNNPPLTSPALLSFQEGYPRACSTSEYRGSRDNFLPVVRLALRNCIQD